MHVRCSSVIMVALSTKKFWAPTGKSFMLFSGTSMDFIKVFMAYVKCFDVPQRKVNGKNNQILEHFHWSFFNPFVANVSILYSLKTPESLWFSGIVRRYKMVALIRNWLKCLIRNSCFRQSHWFPILYWNQWDCRKLEFVQKSVTGTALIVKQWFFVALWNVCFLIMFS